MKREQLQRRVEARARTRPVKEVEDADAPKRMLLCELAVLGINELSSRIGAVDRDLLLVIGLRCMPWNPDLE